MRAAWIRSLGFTLAASLLAAQASAAPASKEIHRTLPISASGLVSIDTYKGSIRVAVWDQNEVQVNVQIVEDSGWVAQDLKEADVEVRSGASDVRVKSRWKSPSFFGVGGSQPNFHYFLRVPKTVRLEIKDYKSDIRVEGVAGDIDLTTYKGTVRLRDLTGGVRLETYKGNVDARFAKYTARSTFETHKGEVLVEVPADTRFTTREILDRHADFRSDFSASDLVARQGSIGTSVQPINGGGPDLVLESHKGSFTLRKR